MENSSGIFSGMLRQIAANAATTIDTQKGVMTPRMSPMVLKASCEEYHRKSQNLETKIQWIKEIKRKNGGCEEMVMASRSTPNVVVNGGEARKRSRKRSDV